MYDEALVRTCCASSSCFCWRRLMRASRFSLARSSFAFSTTHASQQLSSSSDPFSADWSLKATTPSFNKLFFYYMINAAHRVYVWFRASPAELLLTRLASGLRRTLRATRGCSVFRATTAGASSSENLATAARSSTLRWSRTDTRDSVEPLDDKSYSLGLTLPVVSGANFEVTGRGRALILKLKRKTNCKVFVL